MKTPRTLALALAAALAIPAAAVANDVVTAQNAAGPGQGPQAKMGRQGRFAQMNPEERAALRDRVKQKIQTYLTVELSSRAGLDDKKALQLGSAIKSHLEKREAARKTRHEAFVKLRELVDQKANDAALKAQMKTVLDSHGREQGMDDLAAELGKFLTPTEQAKVMVAFPEVMKDAMRLIREARGRWGGRGHGPGMGGGGGGPGGGGPGMPPDADDDLDL